MKKILLLLILTLGLFGVEPSIPSEVGSIDASVYSEDKKTLYTLKDETVTIWNVQPLKKIDSFETTINHLRNYVSEDINTSYLDRFLDPRTNKPNISISKGESYIYVASKYIAEKWSVQNKHLVDGNLKKITSRIKDRVSINVNNRKIMYSQNKIVPSKGMRCITMTVNGKVYYELHINPLYDNNYKLISILGANLFYDESDWTKDIKYIITYDDGTEEVHRQALSGTLNSINATTKKPVIAQYTVTLGKPSSPELYNDVWRSKTIEEAMKKLYGTTKSISSSNSTVVRNWNFNEFVIKTKFDADIRSMAFFGSETEYPILAILQIPSFDAKEGIELELKTHKWVIGGEPDAQILPVDFTIVAQSKENKIYKSVIGFDAFKNNFIIPIR